MTISERIFNLIAERGLTQKEFSRLTDIAESSISDWKRKKTNPASDKILTICHVLGVTPYELLSGTESEGNRSRKSDLIIVDKSSNLGKVLSEYQKLDTDEKEIIYNHILELGGGK